jgi:type I restriction enzyme S subunit
MISNSQPLIKLCSLITDGTHYTPPNVGEGYPFLTVRDMKEDGLDVHNCSKITEEEYQKAKSQNSAPKKGDVLFSKDGTVGKIHVVQDEKDFAILSSIAILRPEPEVLHANFLAHFLRTPQAIFNANNRKTGSALTRIILKDIKELSVPTFQLDEQKRIAAILDQADNLRRARRQTIEKLNSLSQSIFYEMFGDPVKNERQWDVKKLKTLSNKISSGSTPVGGKHVYVDQGTVFLRSQNVWRNRIELDDVVYIDEATHQKMKKTSLKHGDILITKTGRINTENSSLGRAAMFLGENDSANINGHVYLIRPKLDVLKEFVLYIMTTPEYREYIRSVCVGGIDKRQINKEHLEEFPIIYPPIEEQKKFLKCLASIEEQKARFCEQSELSENLFLSLQQRAFRGEL